MVVFKRYGSVAEFAATLTEPRLQCWEDSSESIKSWSDSSMESWGGATFSDTLKYLNCGNPELAAKIKAEGDIIAKKQGEGAPNLENAVYGCVPCVPNYLRGVPKNMLKVDRKYPRKPVIDVYVDATIWDGVNLDRLAQACAKVANVVTATERAGVRVNLYTIVSSRDKKDRNSCYGVCVRIKDSRAPLNLLNIAFPLTSRAFCRVAFCTWMESHVDKVVGGHGSVMSGHDVEQKFGIKGVLLSISDIVRYGTSIDSIATTINAFIAAA